MPLTAGYGKYPVNKSLSISEQTNAHIELEADRRKVSQSEVMRIALDLGLAEMEAGIDDAQ
jgi:hypothetical protein